MDRFLYSVGEVAEMLGMTPQQVHARINRGELKALHVGRSVRVTAASLPDGLDLEDADAESPDEEEQPAPESVRRLRQQPYYADLFKEQERKCAICGTSARYGVLVVDHDHATGFVRGLLCGSCNTALGLFNDSVERLTAAIAYLQDNAVLPRQLVYGPPRRSGRPLHRGRQRPNGHGSVRYRSRQDRFVGDVMLRGKRFMVYGRTWEEADEKLRKVIAEHKGLTG